MHSDTKIRFLFSLIRTQKLKQKKNGHSLWEYFKNDLKLLIILLYVLCIYSTYIYIYLYRCMHAYLI